MVPREGILNDAKCPEVCSPCHHVIDAALLAFEGSLLPSICIMTLVTDQQKGLLSE